MIKKIKFEYIDIIDESSDTNILVTKSQNILYPNPRIVKIY